MTHTDFLINEYIDEKHNLEEIADAILSLCGNSYAVSTLLIEYRDVHSRMKNLQARSGMDEHGLLLAYYKRGASSTRGECTGRAML